MKKEQTTAEAGTACLMGAAALMLQGCADIKGSETEKLCGPWTSVEGKPDVLVYREGDSYKVTVFARSGKTRRLRPQTYLLVEEDGNLFINTGYRIDVVLQRGCRRADLLAGRRLCAEGGAAMRNGKILAFGLAVALGTSAAQAQWVVSDPGNLAQGIINMAENIAHTSKTVP